MTWNRASSYDYDDWAELGNRGWGWEDLLSVDPRSLVEYPEKLLCFPSASLAQLNRFTARFALEIYTWVNKSQGKLAVDNTVLLQSWTIKEHTLLMPGVRLQAVLQEERNIPSTGLGCTKRSTRRFRTAGSLGPAAQFKSRTPKSTVYRMDYGTTRSIQLASSRTTLTWQVPMLDVSPACVPSTLCLRRDHMRPPPTTSQMRIDEI